MIKRCPECKMFTLEDLCAICKKKTVSVKPPRYHPGASYAKYRREARKAQL